MESPRSLPLRADVRNPFPGLRPFGPDEADLFFGRQANVRELLGRLRRTRFLTVAGSSGCGKSSLVMAGLVAALRNGYMVEAGVPWRVAIMRPGDSPMVRLAAALQEPQALGAPHDAESQPSGVVLATLRSGSLGLAQATAEAGLPEHTRLFLLVDQFEELFRFAQTGDVAPADDSAVVPATRSRDEARAFVKLLLEAAAQRDHPVYVALTMRSEFLGDCAGLPGLPDAINQGLYLVPYMTRTQLREAITEPLAARAVGIADRLVNRLLNDIGDEPDHLPLLQHALMRLWTVRQAGASDGPLDLAHYDAIGGLGTALARHLDEAYGELTPDQQPAAEALFRRLTETTDDNRTVRRPARLDAICRAAGTHRDTLVPIIERFRQEGRSFLMPPVSVPLDDDTVVDISHETLIRQWKRLTAWAAAEAREGRFARELGRSAVLWDEQHREPSYLYHGARLASAEEWMKTHAPDAAPLVRSFVEASVALRDEQQVRERERTELPKRLIEEGAVRRDAIRQRTAHAFVSYAHEDRPFVKELADALGARGRQLFVDDTRLLGSASFAEELRSAMDASDTVIVVLSPSAASSQWHRKEVDYALTRGKRLVPILARSVAPEEVHPALVPLQWIDLRPQPVGPIVPDEFDDERLRPLLEALDYDLDWVRGHTRLLVRAEEWDTRARDASLLLRGDDLKEAEAWLAGASAHRQPPVSDLQVAYILASRRESNRVQRRLTWALVTVMAVLLLAAGAASYGWFTAVEQRRAAQDAERRADTARADAEGRLQLLLTEWGQSQATAQQTAGDDRAVQRSLDANARVRTFAQATPYEERQRITIQYYPKQIGSEVEKERLEAALRGLGFTLQQRQPLGVTRTNALWFGSRVDVEDAKLVGYALIRAGVDLKYIGRFRDSTGRELVMQVGGRPESAGDGPLTLDEIDRATDFPPR